MKQAGRQAGRQASHSEPCSSAAEGATRIRPPRKASRAHTHDSDRRRRAGLSTQPSIFREHSSNYRLAGRQADWQPASQSSSQPGRQGMDEWHDGQVDIIGWLGGWVDGASERDSNS